MWKIYIRKVTGQLRKPDRRRNLFHGISIQEILQKNEAEFRKTVQMVFQNPFDTFLQTETIEKIMLRPLVLYRKDMTDEEKAKSNRAVRRRRIKSGRRFPPEISA